MSVRTGAERMKYGVITAAAALAALRLLALQTDGIRVWGLDVLRHLDPGWTVAFSLLPLLAALPAVESKLAALTAKRDVPWTRMLWAAVAVLLAAAVLFPMDTFYYGDGGPLVSEVYKIGAQEHYSSSLLLNLKSAPLSGGLLHLLSVLIPSVMYSLGLKLPETPLFPFLALSLAGSLVLGWSMHLEKERGYRLPLLLLVAGTGGALFFFRYAEMYLPLFLAVTAYLLAASAAIRGERPVWIAVLFYAIAVASHYMALALLPSLLYLLLRKNAVMKRLTATPRALALALTGMLALAFALYFIFGYQHSDSRIIMPLYPVESAAGTLSYTLLSSYHLLDLGNLLLLLAGFPLLCLMFAGFAARKTHGSGKGVTEETGHARGESMRFQLIAGFSFLLFLFFANTSLGLARDWDIAAPLGVMIVMILAEFRATGNDGGGTSRLSAARLLQMGIVSVLFVIPWIAANVDREASTARFADIMTLDDEHMYGDYALSGYEALRKQAVHEKDFDREGEILQRMIEIVGYTEQYRMLIVNALHYPEKRPELYLRLNDWALEHLAGKAAALRAEGRDRDYSIGLKQVDSLAAVIAMESVTQSHMEDLYPRMTAFAERSGCSTGLNILLATGWYMEQAFGKAISLFAAVRNAGFRDARADGMYGICLFLNGDTAQADAEFEDGLQRYADNSQYLFMVATSYLRGGTRMTEARSLLERALSLDPPPEARKQIEDILAHVK